ncbi:MAG: ATP-dependent DNA helicase RecG [Bacteroidales bacterium]
MLKSDIKYLKGVGPKKKELLKREIGVESYLDLLYHFPFRYIDRTKIYTIAQIEPTMQYIQLRGKIGKIQIVGERRAKRLIAKFWDSSGTIDLVFFRRVKSIAQWLKPNVEYILFGKPTIFGNSYNIVHPELELVSERSSHFVGNMMGVYPSTERLKSNALGNREITRLISSLLQLTSPYLIDRLPASIIAQKKLLSYRESLNTIHFPKDNNSLLNAQFRLKFQELLLLQIHLLRQKKIREQKSAGIVMKKVDKHFNFFYSALPFELTEAQKRVIKEIRSDLLSGVQMNRLLQGDVGSGKTMVAILTALLAIDNGYQASIMAPTEVLATQHYYGNREKLSAAGVESALLTGSTTKKEREVIFEALKNGELHLLFGTHALIEDGVEFHNLGFAVIDEQHRFGVEQRAKLWNKGRELPHILVMSATPIPRTLAMTLFGDLDISVIDQLPPGRKEVTTIHATDHRRDRIDKFLKEQIDKGRQVFIVYPLIKESEKMDYKNLQEGYLSIVEKFKAPKYITAVVHGQQKSKDKAHDMELFASGRAHILVSTSVIEVGVDIPNATVMVIESAERFGLSQLHQLRGRVGRGSEESWCILMTGEKLSSDSRKRVELMCSTNDGFELAEADLRLRGPGNMEGTQQSGLPVNLKISNLSKDGIILEEARATALQILKDDPSLQKEENRGVKISLEEYVDKRGEFSQIS